MFQLGGMIISGITGWFKTRQEIKKIKVEGEKEVIVAKTKAEVARVNRESEQDYDLNRIAVENMKSSWKDEFVLVIITMPFVMLFIPNLQEYSIAGLEAMDSSTPLWYQVLVVAIFMSIYGLRDILKIVIQLLLSKFK